MQGSIIIAMDEGKQIEKRALLKSIQTEKKLFAFLFWTSLVHIVLLFFIWNNTTTTLLEKTALAKQKSLVEQKHSQLALFVENIKTNTGAWGTDGRIRELTEKINSSSCENGSQGAISVCKASLELSSYLADSKIPLDPTIIAIDILNIDGIVIASSDTTRIGLDKSKQKISFEEAKILPFGQATFFPEVVSEQSEFGGRPMIHLTTPIASIDNKRLVGVLLLHTGTDELNSIVTENVGLTTEGYLVNKDGIMVTPSRFDTEAVMKQKVDTLPARECIARNASFVGEYADYHKMDVLGASVCDQSLFGFLIVETDRAEIFAEINRLRWIALGVLLIILILIFLYVYFSGANILRGLKHILPSSFSSAATLIAVMSIIILATVGISFIFAKNIRSFIINQKIADITSLVAQQADRHIDHQSGSVFNDWESPNSQLKFKDFSDEILRSFGSVLAVQLHTTSGILAFSSFQMSEVGKSTEPQEISEAIQKGRLVRSDEAPGASSLLTTKPTIEVYLPILGNDSNIAGVAEAYLSTDEISSFTQNIQTILWIGASTALVFIFLLLRYIFRRQDEKIITHEAEISGVIEHSPIGIYTINKGGTIASINPTALNNIGALSTEELLGKNIFDIEKYTNPTLIGLIKQGLSGAEFDKEIEISSQTDTLKKSYYHYYGVPLKNSDDEVASLLLMSENISVRKNLEREAVEYSRSIEGEYRAALTGLDSSAIVSITDEKGSITYANKKFIDVSKYSKEELLGQNHRILKSGDQPQELFEELWSTISSGNIWRGEIKNKAKDGSFYWVDSTIVPILGYDGKPKNYVSIRILISERKEAEERSKQYFKEIVESKIKSDALLASLGEGMFALDDAGVVVSMNPAAEEMIGWAKGDIIGKKLTTIVPITDEKNSLISLWQRSDSTSITSLSRIKRSDKVFFTIKNGLSLPVSITETPIIIGGKASGSVIIFRDVTAENEIEKTRRDLLSLASHQLRTPLSGTKWLIETLKRGIHGPLTKSQDEYLSELYKINERMTALVHDMLSVLRIEGDVTQAKKERVSLATLFAVLFESVSAVAKHKRITLRLEKSDEIEVETDPLLLRSILENLLSNAINYSHNDSEVIVGVTRSEDNIIFKVKDFGIGIPRDEQRQIFERFYRTSNAKTYDTHGTGLGLYVSNTLAKKLGAKLSFESEENMGTTFILNVPIYKTNAL